MSVVRRYGEDKSNIPAYVPQAAFWKERSPPYLLWTSYHVFSVFNITPARSIGPTPEICSVASNLTDRNSLDVESFSLNVFSSLSLELWSSSSSMVKPRGEQTHMFCGPQQKNRIQDLILGLSKSITTITNFVSSDLLSPFRKSRINDLWCIWRNAYWA